MAAQNFSEGLIRVLVVNLSGVLSEFVGQLVKEQPDMALVGQIEGNVEALIAARSGVDVVILGAAQLDPPPGICSHLLNEIPHLKILVVSTSEAKATGYWLGIRRSQFQTVSAISLINDIRNLYGQTPTI
jgi:chemotaxis response regulator CheB